VTIRLASENKRRMFGATVSLSVRSAAKLISLFSRPMPSPIHRDLPINHDCHKFVGSHVFELHDLMPLPRQLSPATRLLGVLFDGLILLPIHGESERS